MSQQPEPECETVEYHVLGEREPVIICVRRQCSWRRRTDDGKVEVRGD